MKVCKFGGTSMANANTIKRVVDVIESDPSRKYIVVSAPGKRTPADVKVTDALYACFNEVKNTGNCDKTFETIEKRFHDIVTELGVELSIDEDLKAIKKALSKASPPITLLHEGNIFLQKFLHQNLDLNLWTPLTSSSSMKRASCF